MQPERRATWKFYPGEQAASRCQQYRAAGITIRIPSSSILKVAQLVLSLVLFAGPVVAAEFRPVAVWTDAEWFPNPPGKYAVGKMIDGDLGTYACLLDDTRTGKNTAVCPPKAEPPVTATFVLDLGSERTVSFMPKRDSFCGQPFGHQPPCATPFSKAHSNAANSVAVRPQEMIRTSFTIQRLDNCH